MSMTPWTIAQTSKNEHTFISHPSCVPGKFYSISGHWPSLFVNFSYLIKYIDSKSHSGGKVRQISLLGSGLFHWEWYIHVFLFLTFSFAFLTSSQRHIKPSSSIQRTSLMQLFWADSQRNYLPPNANQTGRNINHKVTNISWTVA